MRMLILVLAVGLPVLAAAPQNALACHKNSARCRNLVAPSLLVMKVLQRCRHFPTSADSFTLLLEHPCQQTSPSNLAC